MVADARLFFFFFSGSSSFCAPPSPPPASPHRSYPFRRGATRKLDIGGGGGGRRRRIGVTCLDRFSQLVTRYGTSFGGDHTARGVMDPAFDLCPAIFSTEIADTWKFFSRKSMMVMNASPCPHLLRFCLIWRDEWCDGNVLCSRRARPTPTPAILPALYGISRLNTR